MSPRQRTGSARSQAQGTELVPPVPETVCGYARKWLGADKAPDIPSNTVIPRLVRGTSSILLAGFIRMLSQPNRHAAS
jgi:hypothetical protein